jgi:NADP-dependent 3-hydroxy acid dehydrogenase YdfG
MTTVTAVVGAGPGNGAHFAHRFAKGGHAVALLARSQDYLSQLAKEIEGEGGRALPVVMDVADPASVSAAFGRVRGELGEVNHLIQNAAAGPRGRFMEIAPEDFNKGLQVSVMGTVYCCREVLPAMEKLGGGTVTIIGATAAFRGGNGFSGFAVSKFGQRALSQSIAREYGPKGVHVSHVNIDGVIDSARSRGRRGEQPDEFFLQPGDIAEAVWYLVQQPRSAWTQELDLRPHVEKW